MGLKLNEIIYIFDKIENKLSKHEKYLNELDNIIGDGDHGTNISKVFKIAKEKINNENFKDWGEMFKGIGSSITASVGEISGSLYGIAFTKSSIIGRGKNELTFEDLRRVLDVSIDAIKIRGKSEKGDKTMLDAMIPALDEINYGIENKLSVLNTFKNAIGASKDGIEHTKLIAAARGKASYLGDKSRGHQDPGATSSLMILEAIYEGVKELKNKS